MLNSVPVLDVPKNEPVRGYLPGSPERASLKARLKAMASETIEIPLIVGGKEVRTGKLGEHRCPHDHAKVLARYHMATPEVVEQAVAASQDAWKTWSELPVQSRLAVFLRMAELLAGPWRDTVNAATMLGQSKTCHQAEIDSACELIDFYRFNPWYALHRIYTEQPWSPQGTWNSLEFRPLEGFVFAVTPFNFTSIAGNLPTAPAMMGNVVLWKPASSTLLSNYYLMRLFEAAGLPPGVINFVPGRGSSVGNPVLASPHLAGIHFTGSTPVFQDMWKQIGDSIARYRGYPRIVGETGGKDFIFAHPSADVEALVTAAIRGAFEFQGQKCSAASRMYVPKSLWTRFRDRLVAELETVRMGDVSDFRNFMGAVIDEGAFDTIVEYVEHAKASPEAKIVFGGGHDKSRGWFIQPTVVQCLNPRFRTMEEEIFGPVLSIHVYDDAKEAETLDLLDTTSPYALTGAIFAEDRHAVSRLATRLRHAAGNFYVNDKPTGAVVGQQPFGGARASGTNDKAGSVLNLLRWVSARAIKENLLPPKDYRYGFLNEA
jgi:1-pyrroline-5-carboxylate dehydrogenase